jgi:hypothetical protein
MPESEAMPQSQTTASSDTSKSRVAWLRHPLVVGATIAVISAFFASLLIPSITQVTQDRPKELELKRGIVERIAGATGTALGRGRAIVELHEPRAVYRQAITDWGVEAAAVNGEITTYFGRGDTWQRWWTLREGTKKFLELTSVPDTRERNEKWLCGHLGAYLSNPDLETNLARHCKKHHFRDEKSFRKHSFVLSLALEDVRDGVTLDIVETPAAGFRHSPWSLG